MEELLSHCPRWVLPGRGRPALCAVSGGLDSMCLLDLLDRWCRERDGRVVAAHFNHRLRGAEADRDETFVRDWCAAHDIAFVSGSGDVRGLMEREGLSLEEAARKLRYDFLRQEAEKLGQYIKIYTAHHADDNAETILFNLIRGTGVAGLTGMAYQQDGICRPLLDVTREELAAYAAARHIPHVEDTTNADPGAAARNFLRLEVHAPLEADQPQSCGAHQRRRTPPAGGGPVTGGRGRPPYCPCGGAGGAGDLIPAGIGGGHGRRATPDAAAALRPAGRGAEGYHSRPSAGHPAPDPGYPLGPGEPGGPAPGRHRPVLPGVADPGDPAPAFDGGPAVAGAAPSPGAITGSPCWITGRGRALPFGPGGRGSGWA